MDHGGDIYNNIAETDFSVSLNPFPVPKELKIALREGIERLGTYPEPGQTGVRNAIALAENTDPSRILAGNGASEMIMAVIRHLMPRRAVLIEPGFTGYEHALRSVDNCDIHRIFLDVNKDFIPGDDITDKIPKDTEVMFLCDPWNPLGYNINEDIKRKILDFTDRRGISLILDESFLPLSEKMRSFDRDEITELTERYPGLYIIRSYTKLFSMPGLRMGYLISSPSNIIRIMKQLPEWNLSVIAEQVMKAGADCVRRSDFIRASLDRIAGERDHITRKLREYGCYVYKSDTVFITFKSNPSLYHRLLEERLMIRDLSGIPGLYEGFYRIGIRSKEENRRLLEQIKVITRFN